MYVRRALSLVPISFTKRNGQKKSCPEIKRPWRAPTAQPVMSPRRDTEKPSAQLRYGATLNALDVRPPHLPKFRDLAFSSFLLIIQSPRNRWRCGKGGSFVRLISVHVLKSLLFLRTLTHRYYGMCVRCYPRAFPCPPPWSEVGRRGFRRPFLVTLLDEQKSNDKLSGVDLYVPVSL
jgi:hypothetical protein